MSDPSIVREALDYLDGLYQRGIAFTSPNKAGEFFCLRLGQYEHEVFACAFLDNRHNLIAVEELFRGTIDAGFGGFSDTPGRCSNVSVRANRSIV